MIFKKKRVYKPLYKQFLNLRTNIQSRDRVFKFRKQKWKPFVNAYRKKFKRYNKNLRPRPQVKYKVHKFTHKYNTYKKRYLLTLRTFRLFKLYYGGFKDKTFKKKLKIIRRKISKNHKNNKPLFSFKNQFTLKKFERRIDTVLYRARFSSSMRNSRQLISHGRIFVNNKKVKSKSLELRTGDIVTVDFKYHPFIIKNINNSIRVSKFRHRIFSTFWPLPPKDFMVNYKTLQILLFDFKKAGAYNFPENLDLERILNSKQFFL